jgi:hypothetical protein
MSNQSSAYIVNDPITQYPQYKFLLVGIAIIRIRKVLLIRLFIVSNRLYARYPQYLYSSTFLPSFPSCTAFTTIAKTIKM